ncbi:MFS transporter [Microbulbifer sp. GL-2]|uniref:MFS transporter n=1 Tax=Microbulbifer sp. GL-2 TaxID=2591606 RepID=UPI00116411A5|nr:MFS transporter [Microbulbifer sp. GL-2]BBM03633.1 MFS transporter [Microbulbifer sp. GL-2]
MLLKGKVLCVSSQESKLVVLYLAVFLLGYDFTALPVAIPSIQREFEVNLTTVQWIINGYTLVLGVLIITGGRVADMFGRRKMFIWGAIIFIFFSILAGISDNIGLLIVFRSLMGIGVALMWPALLGMIYDFMPGEQSGFAGGMIVAIVGISNAIGPIIGGVLTDLMSWRWILFVNIPFTGVLIFLFYKLVPKIDIEVDNKKIDYMGVATLSISLLCILIALDLSVDMGFKSPLIVILISAFFVFIGIFSIVEYKEGKSALIPSDVIGNYKFLFAGISTLLISVVFLTALLLVPQYLNFTNGNSVISIGLSLLPMMLALGCVSYVSGQFYKKLGAKSLASAGALCVFIGMFILAHIHKYSSNLQMVSGLILLGAGIGMFFSTITTLAITVVDSSRASLAGGIIYMLDIMGGSLGLGLSTTIVALAPDFLTGISRAFTVNAYLALAGFIICIFYVSEGSITKNWK